MLFALPACKTTNFFEDPTAITGNNPSLVPPPDTKKVAVTPHFSKQVAAQHTKILATYGGEYSDVNLERMVAKIVGRLTFYGNDPEQVYHITILDSPSVNAFALSGGFVYVTRGLLALANDSSELAAVIAHEMAHVTAKHGLQRQRFEEKSNLTVLVASQVLSEGVTAKQALIKNKLKIAQFSRNQELEADDIGIKASTRAGYDPFAAARFLGSLGTYTNFRAASHSHDVSLDFLASHPVAPQRVELAKRLARQFAAPDSMGQIERDTYLNGIDGMLFGNRSETGFTRGQDFIHKGFSITYRLPLGFDTEINKDAVVSSGTNEVAVRFDAVDLPLSVDLDDYVRSGWVAGLQQSSVQSTKISEFDAVIAKAQADKWKFNIVVLRNNGKIYRFLVAAPLNAQNLDATTAQITGSLRVLSRNEQGQNNSTRIRVVTVKSGDNLDRLINQMSGVDRIKELFYTINAIPENTQIHVGQKLKIITDQ
jgi:predicted Zn-dependent protease